MKLFTLLFRNTLRGDGLNWLGRALLWVGFPTRTAAPLKEEGAAVVVLDLTPIGQRQVPHLSAYRLSRA